MATTTNNKLSFGAGRILREGTPYLQAPRASILVKHALKKTNKKTMNSMAISFCNDFIIPNSNKRIPEPQSVSQNIK
jgi:hypothetical protein